jgi:hypothetical protein
VTDVVAFGEVLLRLSVGGGELLESAPAFDVHVAGSEANVVHVTPAELAELLAGREGVLR